MENSQMEKILRDLNSCESLEISYWKKKVLLKILKLLKTLEEIWLFS